MPDSPTASDAFTTHSPARCSTALTTWTGADFLATSRLLPGVVSGAGRTRCRRIQPFLHILRDLDLLGFCLAGLGGLCGRHGCGRARDFRAATRQTTQQRGDGGRDGERDKAIRSVHVGSLCRGTEVCT